MLGSTLFCCAAKRAGFYVVLLCNKTCWVLRCFAVHSEPHQYNLSAKTKTHCTCRCTQTALTAVQNLRVLIIHTKQATLDNPVRLVEQWDALWHLRATANFNISNQSINQSINHRTSISDILPPPSFAETRPSIS